MKRNKHVNKIRKNLIVMSMMFSLVAAQIPTHVSNAASDGAADELRTLIRANLIKNYDPDKDGAMHIVHTERSRYASDVLTYEAQTLEANAGDRPAKYALCDIDLDGSSEMFIQWKESGKSVIQIHRYDDAKYTTKLVSAFSDVTEVRTNEKKKQILIVRSTGKNKKTITAYKMNNSGKLKSVSVYKQNGKKYSKGSKKITKKAFNSYNKTVNKLNKVSFVKIPDIDYSYNGVDELFLGKGEFYRWFVDDVGQESLYMTKGTSGASSENRFLAYSYAYDLVGWHEYSDEGGYTRYVFGPDVTDPKTGKTYREEDWEAMRKEEFGEKNAPYFLTEHVYSDGSKVLDIESDGELYDVEVAETEADCGKTKYKARAYSQEYGDCRLSMVFFAEGPYKDRIARAGIFYPNISGDLPEEAWTFSYDADAGNPAKQSTKVYDKVTYGGKTSEFKPRVLNIYDASGKLSQRIRVDEAVRFELYGKGAGQFYTFNSDATKMLLPVELETIDDEYNESWVDYENMLNPATGQMSYGDPVFEENLYWEAK